MIPLSVWVHGQERMDQNYTQFLQVDGLEGARVGVLRQLSDTPTTDPEVLSLFNQAVADMAANGEHCATYMPAVRIFLFAVV